MQNVELKLQPNETMEELEQRAENRADYLKEKGLVVIAISTNHASETATIMCM